MLNGMKEIRTREHCSLLVFEYERFELSKPVRRWWTYGFDPKWYLSPFPQTEINKGYGLIQNPGW